MRIYTIILFVIGFGIRLTAQSFNNNYVQMRDEGVTLMANFEYSAAFRMFDGASGFANSKRDKSELVALQQRLEDSVQSTYSRGIRLIENANKDTDFLVAIQELKKLIPTDGLDVPLLFSWLGTAYEQLNKLEDAINYYSLGINHEEPLSALLLANLLQMQNAVSADSLVSLYQYATTCYNDAYDRLGDLYFSTSPQDAYSYYKASKSNYGKYQRAMLLLDKKASSSDDPVKLLKILSDDNCVEAQFKLGVMYYQGELVARNEDKGVRLIRSAKDNGCIEALHWITDFELEQKDTAAKENANRINNNNHYRRDSMIDWDVDYISMGLAYSYSKHFQIAFSADFTISHFLLGLEVGLNVDKDKIYRSKIETETYSRIETDDPLGYFLLFPGAYFKYFSVSCGIGSILAKNQVTTSSSLSIINEDENGSSIIMQQSNSSQQNKKFGFLLKPSIAGYIPIGDDVGFITLSVGYNYLPSFKELNGFSFGIGFQGNID